MTINNSSDYILVTPLKDEEKNLRSLIKSVALQSIPPTIWCIVNDGSIDSSPKIIQEACNKYKWIINITLPISKRDIGFKYSYVCKKGFDYTINYCKKKNISYEFIGLLDADIIIEKDYYKKLLEHLCLDPKLGITSGGTWSFNGESYFQEKVRSDLPSGAARLWRKRCFEETDGYIITYAPDSVSNIKAKIRGWKTKRFEEIKAKQIRMTSSAEGSWIGFKKKGEGSYFLYQHPIKIIITFLKYLIQRKIVSSFAYLFGYMESVVNKRNRTKDNDIIRFNRTMRLRILKDYWLKNINLEK